MPITNPTVKVEQPEYTFEPATPEEIRTAMDRLAEVTSDLWTQANNSLTAWSSEERAAGWYVLDPDCEWNAQTQRKGAHELTLIALQQLLGVLTFEGEWVERLEFDAKIFGSDEFRAGVHFAFKALRAQVYEAIDTYAS